MEQFNVEKGDAVITEGNEGDYFYVVEDGSFEIIVGGEIVGTLDEVCSAFGELALMHNSPRAATVMATSRGILWGLDRNTFRSTIAARSVSTFEGIKTFLLKVDILKGEEGGIICWGLIFTVCVLCAVLFVLVFVLRATLCMHIFCQA